MVVDIGGGTTEIAVLSLTGVVAMHSIKVGGDTFDAAIIDAAASTSASMVGPLTAEALKIKLRFRRPATRAGAAPHQRLRHERVPPRRARAK